MTRRLSLPWCWGHVDAISAVCGCRRGAGGRAAYDFTSWEGTRELTASLLGADFDVTWWLPEGQLVPTLTSRLNYMHWMHDLLALSCPPGCKGERCVGGRGEGDVREGGGGGLN